MCVTRSIALPFRWKPRLTLFPMPNRLTVPFNKFILFTVRQRSIPFRCPVSLLFIKNLPLAQRLPPIELVPTSLHPSSPRDTKVAILVPVHPPKFLSRETLNAPPTLTQEAELLIIQGRFGPTHAPRQQLPSRLPDANPCPAYLIRTARTKSAMGINLRRGGNALPLRRGRL